MDNLPAMAVLIAALGLVLALAALASRKFGRLNRRYYAAKWREIDALARAGGSGFKVAVIDADKLLDKALRERGIKGTSMGERLKNASYLKNIDAAWSAHKLRNRLVHEADAKFGPAEAKRALGGFKKTLKELGAL